MEAEWNRGKVAGYGRWMWKREVEEGGGLHKMNGPGVECRDVNDECADGNRRKDKKGPNDKKGK